jgi:glycosyltransferase involved in cell wall biosynthesis
MNSKIFSIITVCLNSQNTIEKTIESVLKQQKYVREYIIIDGLSEDSTLNIIQKYKDQFKLKNILLNIISEKDNGIYDAMNKGINICKGKIISLLNSDDWYENDALFLILDFFSKNPNVDIIHGNLNYHCEGKIKKHVPKNKSNFFWLGMTLNHPTFFVRANVYKKINYNSNYKVAGDYDFLLKTISMKIQYGYLNKTLVNFSSGGASSNLFISIKEQHKAKIENGFGSFITWISTLFMIFLIAASFLNKTIIKLFHKFYYCLRKTFSLF